MRKQRYNIMLNPALVRKIDYHASKLDKTRSELINYILYDCLKDFGDVPDLSDQEIEDQIDIAEVTT